MAAPLGFKDFTTGEVLTAADVDGYLMQGIWVFANSTARDAAVTSPQEGNSCYLKDTDVIQVYSGSSWVVKSGGSSPLTTKGDLYTYSTTDTRLAVGANDTVLTADSSTATGLKWATPASGGMTLLSTTTLSGASTTISGISGSYNDLAIVIFGVTNATDTGAFRCAPNGSTNITDFINVRTSVLNLSNGGYLEVSGTSTNGPLYTDATNSWTINIKNYASTTSRKPVEVYGTYINGSSVRRGYFLFGGINTTSAITSLVFDNSGGNLSTGTVLLYGVK